MLRARFLLVASCAALISFAAAAAAPSLHVKTGLWEMTWTGQSSGAPPIPPEVLARATPEQRARFQAAIAASMQKNNQAHTRKQCITERVLERGMNIDQNNGSNCHQTIITNTGSVMDIRQECTGPRQKTSGTFHFEAKSAEAMVGSINMVISDGTHTLTMKQVLQGRWLAANCGDVKPAE